MRLRTFIHRLHWNFLTWVGLIYATVGLAWLLVAVPFEDRWEIWIQRLIILGIGFFLIVLSRKRRRKR